MCQNQGMALSDEDKQWIRDAVQGIVQPLATREEMERVETRLLTEFHKWASPNEARQRALVNMAQAFDLDLTDLKDRVKKLEDTRPSQ